MGAHSNQPQHAQRCAEAESADDERVLGLCEARAGGNPVRCSVLAWTGAEGMRMSHERVGSQPLETLADFRSQDSEHGTSGDPRLGTHVHDVNASARGCGCPVVAETVERFMPQIHAYECISLAL
jgi:hypothetical protein